VKNIFVRSLSTGAIILSCYTLLSLSACGKRGPLYFEKPTKVDTTETTAKQNTKDEQNTKDTQTEK